MLPSPGVAPGFASVRTFGLNNGFGRFIAALQNNPMTRSPLLQHLQRVLVGLPAGGSADIAPDPGRRSFMAQGTALGGAMLAGSASLPGLAAEAATGARVAIVGGGLAGLTAGYALRKAGIEATLFEAADRLGGRCFSERQAFAEGQVAERGGEFIDTPHTAIIALARELGLELDDVIAAEGTANHSITWLDGAEYSDADATRDFQPVYPVVQAQARALGDHYGHAGSNKTAKQLDAMSVADWIDRHVPGGRRSKLGRVLDNAYVEEYAVETERLSAITLVTTLKESPKDDFGAYTGSDQHYHVRGGNDQIVARLAAAQQAGIVMGAKLTALERLAGGRYRVTTDTNGAATAEDFDRVILALPFTLLREVDLSGAGFRPLKLRAIRELPMGRSSKLQLQFSERLWRDRECNGMATVEGSFHSSWEVTRAQPGKAGVLNFWSGGDVAAAVGSLQDQDAAGAALRDIEPLWRGMTARWNGRVIVNVWDRNPWSRGSYAYYPPGYMTSIYGIEPEPEGNCFFAGEHTSMQWQGFLNGAVESGLRAAAEVVHSLAPARTPGTKKSRAKRLA